ncbi:MAG: hypothetical protein BIFFINMI_00392 [Phycisphaerae bacterium]|nr:hypothetical protein [Phycisphaerae bacterium]
MGRKLTRPLPSGIIIVHGQPGAGKSYWAVSEIIDMILLHGRPVWTNLPLKLRTFQAYLKLKGRSADWARYIRILTVDHFTAFVKRLERIDKLTQRILKKRLGGGDVTKVEEELLRGARATAVRIIDRNDPPQITGSKANHIPGGAVLVIDELHKWYPGYRVAGGRAGDEPPEVLAYTSMHRHLMHRIYCLTQDAKNVSLSFRSMAMEYIFGRDISQQRFFFGFKFPLKCFNYACFNALDVRECVPRPGARPTYEKALIPSFEGWVFYRLYESYTHGGGVDAVRRELDATLDKLGVEGERKKVHHVKTRKGPGRRVFGWVRRRLWRATVLGVVFYLGFKAAGAGRRSSGPSEAAGPVAAAPAPAAVPAVGAAVVKVGPEFRLRGVTPGGVFIEGKFISVGEKYHGAELVYCDPAQGSATFHVVDVLYVTCSMDYAPTPRVLSELDGSRIPERLKACRGELARLAAFAKHRDKGR